MESILRDEMVSHLSKHNLIRASQHGFMAGRSCLTNLLEYLEELTSLVDMGHEVDIVYLGFAKVFDKVPHIRLLAKKTENKVTNHLNGVRYCVWCTTGICVRSHTIPYLHQ